MTTLFLIPRKTKDSEFTDAIEIEIQDKNGYPSAIVHVDTFWDGISGENEIHNRLNSGETLRIELKVQDE